MLSEWLMAPVSTNGSFLLTMLLLVALIAGLWTAMIKMGGEFQREAYLDVHERNTNA